MKGMIYLLIFCPHFTLLSAQGPAQNLVEIINLLASHSTLQAVEVTLTSTFCEDKLLDQSNSCFSNRRFYSKLKARNLQFFAFDYYEDSRYNADWGVEIVLGGYGASRGNRKKVKRKLEFDFKTITTALSQFYIVERGEFRAEGEAPEFEELLFKSKYKMYEDALIRMVKSRGG